MDRKTNMVILGAWEGEFEATPLQRGRAYMFKIMQDWFKENHLDDLIYDQKLLMEMEEYASYGTNKEIGKREILDYLLNHGVIRMKQYLYYFNNPEMSIEKLGRKYSEHLT